MILGLQILKRLGEKRISTLRVSELIINQIKGQYAAKHPRLRAYRNAIVDFLQSFYEYDFFVIPRGQNTLADALPVSTNTCKIHFHSNRKYLVEVKYGLVVPNNVIYW